MVIGYSRKPTAWMPACAGMTARVFFVILRLDRRIQAIPVMPHLNFLNAGAGMTPKGVF